MPKKILFVDLGDVLVKFEEKYLKVLLREEKFENFISLVHEHDRGNLELFDFHKLLTEENYFRSSVSWGEFIKAFATCIYDVHTPMFIALTQLKKRGVKLVCLTDNNHFCFYMSSFKFPGVCELFHDNGKEQWMLSYKFTTLKRDKGLGLFTRLPGKFGQTLKNSAFVDNLNVNIEKAIEAGFKKNACFLYDRFDPKNHERFLKFLDKHFPAN